MKKVLIVSGADELGKQARLDGVVKSFEDEGFKVELFNYRKYYSNHFSLLNKVRNLIFLRKVKEYKPDVVFVTKGESLLLGVIRKVGAKTVNWTVDDIFGVHNPRMRIGNMAEYDLLLSYDRFCVRELMKRGLNADYLPCVAATDMYKSLDVEKIYDVTFIGSHDAERENLFKELVEFDLHIWGPRWDLVKDERLVGKVKEGDSRQKAYVKLLNQSKITVNLHHKQSIESTNFRTFEALACGIFVLVDYNPELEKLFEIGKEIVVYRGVDELKKLIRYYLDHPEEREKIAKAGQERVVKDYSVKVAFKNMIEKHLV